MERQYYLIHNMRTDTITPILCDGYQTSDGGWIEFYTGNMDYVVMGIPPQDFWFMQISKEEFDAAEALDEDEDLSDYER